MSGSGEERPARLEHPQPGAGLRDHLRLATRELHDRVEAAVALDRRMRSLGEYRTLLGRLLGFHRPFEAALARLDWSGLGIDIVARRKASWLEADLQDLGLSPAAIAAVPVLKQLPELGTPEAGLGCLYVLEGSTLGGQVILRRVHGTLGVHLGWGGRFFNSYGRQVGPMWRACTAALDAIDVASAAAARVEAAAVATFLAFEGWLAGQAGAAGGLGSAQAGDGNS